MFILNPTIQRLIVIDLDKTLLNKKHKISKANTDAIRLAQERGVIVAMATGRHKQSAYSLLKEVGLKCPIIGSTGATVHDEDGHELANHIFHKDQVAAIIHMWEELNLRYQLFALDGTRYYSPDVWQRIAKEINDRLEQTNQTKLLPDDLSDLDKDIRTFLAKKITKIQYVDEIQRFKKMKFVQFCGFTFDPLKQAILMDQLHELGVNATKSGNKNCIEITPLKANKRDGILTLISQLREQGKIAGEVEIYALGDSDNDLPMFELADRSYIMGNKPLGIYYPGALIMDHHNKNGAAQAIHRILNREFDKEKVQPRENLVLCQTPLQPSTIYNKHNLSFTGESKPILAIDFDGTLLDNNYKISRENIRWIQNAQEEGYEVVIVAGRPYQHVHPMLKEAGLQCHIVSSTGARVHTKDGTLVAEHPLTMEQVERIWRAFERDQVRYQMFATKGRRMFSPNFWLRYMTEVKFARSQRKDGTSLSPEQKQALKKDAHTYLTRKIKKEEMVYNLDDIGDRKIVQMIGFSFDSKQRAKWICDLQKIGVYMVPTEINSLEVTSAKATKAQGLLTIANSRKITL